MAILGANTGYMAETLYTGLFKRVLRLLNVHGNSKVYPYFTQRPL